MGVADCEARGIGAAGISLHPHGSLFCLDKCGVNVAGRGG